MPDDFHSEIEFCRQTAQEARKAAENFRRRQTSDTGSIPAADLAQHFEHLAGYAEDVAEHLLEHQHVKD